MLNGQTGADKLGITISLEGPFAYLLASHGNTDKITILMTEGLHGSVFFAPGLLKLCFK